MCLCLEVLWKFTKATEDLSFELHIYKKNVEELQRLPLKPFHRLFLNSWAKDPLSKGTDLSLNSIEYYKCCNGGTYEIECLYEAWDNQHHFVRDQGKVPIGTETWRMYKSSLNYLERGKAISTRKNQLGCGELWEDSNVDDQKSGLFLVCPSAPENEGKCLDLSPPSLLSNPLMAASNANQHSTHSLFKDVWNPEIKGSMLIKYHHAC